jgi:hypothetical protein
VREQARDLRDREHKDQVEKELERRDLVPIATFELALDARHAATLARRRIRAREREQGGGTLGPMAEP